MTELAKIFEKSELDEGSGPRGAHRIDVPADWLSEAARVSLVLPKRVPCARCDGGGCDGCARSGAIRLPDEDDARVMELKLPASEEDVRIRVARPLESDALEQLILEVRVAEEPSDGCERIEEPEEIDEAPGSRGGARSVGVGGRDSGVLVLVISGALLVAAIAAALLRA